MNYVRSNNLCFKYGIKNPEKEQIWKEELGSGLVQ